MFIKQTAEHGKALCKTVPRLGLRVLYLRAQWVIDGK